MFVIALRKMHTVAQRSRYTRLFGILSTNKRVYCKLYTILYKSSQKFYSKMPLLHPIQRRSGMLLLVRLQLRSLSVELLQLN